MAGWEISIDGSIFPMFMPIYGEFHTAMFDYQRVAFEMSTWYYNFIRTWDTLNPNGLASGSSLEYS